LNGGDRYRVALLFPLYYASRYDDLFCRWPGACWQVKSERIFKGKSGNKMKYNKKQSPVLPEPPPAGEEHFYVAKKSRATYIGKG